MTVAALQDLDQHLADARELVHVLVAVHMVGGRAPGGLEGVELPLDLAAGLARVDANLGALDVAWDPGVPTSIRTLVGQPRSVGQAALSVRFGL